MRTGNSTEYTRQKPVSCLLCCVSPPRACPSLFQLRSQKKYQKRQSVTLQKSNKIKSLHTSKHSCFGWRLIVSASVLYVQQQHHSHANRSDLPEAACAIHKFDLRATTRPFHRLVPTCAPDLHATLLKTPNELACTMGRVKGLAADASGPGP